MPDVEMDDRNRSGFTAHGNTGLVRILQTVHIAVRVGYDAGRAIFEFHVLGIIESHGPPVAVVTQLIVAPVAVFVPSAAGPVGFVEMAMAVGVHGIAGPEDGGEGAADFGLVEHSLDFGMRGRTLFPGFPSFSKTSSVFL